MYFELYEKEYDSQNNYNKYIRNKDSLKNAVLQHPEGEDKIFNFVKKNINRRFWLNNNLKPNKNN